MALHKKLAHLTPEQVDDLVRRYNEGEKLVSLTEAFNIDAKPAGLVHLLPPSSIKTCSVSTAGTRT